MKKKFFILLLLTSMFSFSQKEKANYKKVSNIFANNYNKGDYDAIFDMFDANMQMALPKERTITFFQKNVAPNGKIEKLAFSDLKLEAHIYKATFEKGVFELLISLGTDHKINGFYLKPFIPKDLPVLEKNSTKMILPFHEEWTVSWGGVSVEDNYHVNYHNQKYAYDLLMTKEGKTYNGDAKKNENYYVFGKEIIAPCDATVVNVIKGVKDNVPGEFNPEQVTGNTVVLKTANNEFILFAHFKENSIVVEENQQIKQGDLLGLCGNSGNSSEPHLHLSLQNVADMNIATGAKLFFENIKVNGSVKENYIPVKNDKVQNTNL
ncbi:peptidoglycan DD-metalloendopeptidase family protein [Polaribacter sp. Hel_I_88]|uniref:peptidoglycan DD-metalloendopeptidase family protein n=1 Tax=Polaribacter sp. Hel_I_88 TaxID=1250006 RepID=UPI00047A1DEB|nr:peptidoglycan DD-metalloendopeptidase family protein [Polaribacter sp. Hel_I_88]